MDARVGDFFLDRSEIALKLHWFHHCYKQWQTSLNLGGKTMNKNR